MNTELLKNKLLSHKGKTIKLDALYEEASKIYSKSVEDLQNIYYDEFYALIKELENQGTIKVCGKDKTTVNPSLYKKYTILKENFEFTEEERINMAKLNKVNLSYYKSRVKDFRKDYEIIEKLNRLLRDVTPYSEMSLNEISYAVFGYEKYMAKIKDNSGQEILGRAREVMRNLKIKEEDLNCRKKHEPLLNMIFKEFYEKEKRNILIVENIETYWSLLKIFRENYSGIDMIIWGQGFSINYNFAGVILYGVNENDNIYYFGDIDLSGVDIFLKLKERYEEFKIMPSVRLYEYGLEAGMKRGINKSVSQDQLDIDEERLNIFLSEFKSEHREKLFHILKDRYYIPQEALNYNVLKEVFASE